MKLVSKLIAAFGLLVLAMCIIAPNALATDYSAAEIVAEKMLLDPANKLGITNADVSINTQQVTINCITRLSVQETGAPLESFGTFLGGVLGVYISIVNAMPEVCDLLIVMKNSNQPTVATLSCPKSWVSGIDLNNEAAAQLIVNVFMTIKEA